MPNLNVKTIMGWREWIKCVSWAFAEITYGFIDAHVFLKADKYNRSNYLHISLPDC